MTVKGLLIGSDAEVAAIVPNSGEIPQLVPPAFMRYEMGAKVLRDYGDDTHPVFVEVINGDSSFIWFQDGALFETASPPVKTAEHLFNTYDIAKGYLKEYLSDFNLDLFDKPVASFDVDKYVRLGSEEVRKACIAGCSPDFDAIDENYECIVRDLTDWEYRGMGGHLHLSIGDEYGDILHTQRNTLVRLLAILVGNVGIMTSADPRLEKIRRSQFGAAGRHRFPTYPSGKKGIEYRSLSSSWLNSLETTEMIVENAVKSIDILLENKELAEHLIVSYLKPTVDAIKRVSPKKSMSILREIKQLV